MTLAEAPFLVALAGLLVTFLGFTSIVLVLHQGTNGAISRLHATTFRFYLESGLLNVFYLMLPIAIAQFGVSAATVWRIGSAVAALGGVGFVVHFQRRRRGAGLAVPATLSITAANVLSLALSLALLVNAMGIPHDMGGPIFAAVELGSVALVATIFVRNFEMFVIVEDTTPRV